MKKIIIFLGAPGSGKGTQAKNLAKKYGYVHFSTGDLLRKMATEATNLTDEEKNILDGVTKHGQLAPDALIYKLAFSSLEKIIAEGKGVVLDGAIRTLAQAEEYQKFFEKKDLLEQVEVIEVAISDEESMKRITSRRVCNNCGEIVAVTGSAVSVCPKCGGKLVERVDDKPEIVKKRIEVQGNMAIAPLREYYQSLGELVVIDGMKTIPEVLAEIESVLRK